MSKAGGRSGQLLQCPDRKTRSGQGAEISLRWGRKPVGAKPLHGQFTKGIECFFLPEGVQGNGRS